MKTNCLENNQVGLGTTLFEPLKKSMRDFAEKLNGDEYFRQHQNFFEQSALTFTELTPYTKYQVPKLTQEQKTHEISIVPDSPSEFVLVHHEPSLLSIPPLQKNLNLNIDSVPRKPTNTHPFQGISAMVSRTSLSKIERFKQIFPQPPQNASYQAVSRKPYHVYLDAFEAELTLSAYDCSEEEQQTLAQCLKKEGQQRGIRINLMINGVKK